MKDKRTKDGALGDAGIKEKEGVKAEALEGTAYNLLLRYDRN